jgi:hypothetical protein
MGCVTLGLLCTEIFSVPLNARPANDSGPYAFAAAGSVLVTVRNSRRILGGWFRVTWDPLQYIYIYKFPEIHTFVWNIYKLIIIQRTVEKIESTRIRQARRITLMNRKTWNKQIS